MLGVFVSGGGSEFLAGIGSQCASGYCFWLLALNLVLASSQLSETAFKTPILCLDQLGSVSVTCN